MADILDDENNASDNKPGAKTDDVLEAVIKEQLGEEQAKDESTSNTDTEGQTEDGQATSEDKTAKQAGDGTTTDGSAKPEQKPQEQKSGNPKDLILPDGTVIRGGMERRLYEQKELFRQQVANKDNTINQLRSSNEALRRDLQAFREASSFVQGLPVEEVAQATQLARALKENPGGTLKLLLTEAAKAGIQVEGAINGVEVRAAVDAIRQELGPVAQQQQQQQDILAIEQEVTQFYAAFPDARLHDSLLAEMLSRDDTLTLGDAYYQLRNAFIERGLDWNIPLSEQLDSATNSPNQQQQQPAVAPKAPMTNGRSMVQAPVSEPNRTAVAPADASTADIVREAMRDAGLNV
jgi:hypothetical protein